MEERSGFSILIPTWNNLPYLQLCLESIFSHSSLDHQVIVIVNEGTDGTREWLKNRIDLDVLAFSKNAGICEALNKGALIASTDYILYMNDDMYVLPGWDQVLMDEIKSIGHEKFFLSSTMIEPTDTGNACVLVKDYGNGPDDFKRTELLKEYTSLTKKDWNGATWPPNIMHRNMWKEVKGMSMEFSPGFYSDPDLSMKLWQAGVRYFKGLDNSKVYHFGTKSTGRVQPNDGKKTFLDKWGITPGDFVRYYLRRGEKFTGPLPEAHISWVKKITNQLKKRLG